MNFMEISYTLLQTVDPCNVGNLDEYLLSTCVMLTEMLTCNNHDYCKWRPDYWTMISSLPYGKKKYFSEHFSQSVTDLPYSNQPMDLWIEVNVNLNLKLKQGWLQLLQNNTQFFCPTRNVDNVARTKTTLKNNLNCNCCHQKHVNASQQE